MKKETELAIQLNNKGHNKYMKVEFDEALKLYNEALTYDMKLPIIYYNRGTVNYRMGCFKEALEDFKEAVTLNPQHEDYKLGLKACEESLEELNRR